MSLLLSQLDETVFSAVDAVGTCVGIAEVWGVLIDAQAPGSGAFQASTVRIVYHVDPPNRFWPKKTLKPY